MKLLKPLQLILFFMLFHGVSGQVGVEIKEVDYRLENNLIIVQYNLISPSPAEKYTIGLRFISNTGQVVEPRSLSGDVGKNIEPGIGKVITWNFRDDRFEFSGMLKAVVTLTYEKKPAGGPSYVILSVIVPGLGGYFVEEDRIRPVATTVSTLGLMTFGIIEKSKSNKYYDDYLASNREDELQSLYDKANNAHHKYFIATRIAVAIWIADIVWVAVKGSRNMKSTGSSFQSPTNSGLTLGYLNNELLVGYRITLPLNGQKTYKK